MSTSIIKNTCEMAEFDKKKEELFAAVESNNLEAVRFIIDTLPTTFYKPWFSGCPLIIKALQNRQLEIAKILIRFHLLTKESHEVFFAAIMYGDLETVQLLQECNQYLPSTLFDNNLPVVFLIAKRFIVDMECSRILDYLLSDDKDINFKKVENGYTILHFATECGNINLISMLLNKNCDVNSVTNDGRTALHIAANSGQEEIVSLLLNNGAQHDMQDSCKKTPLHLANEKNCKPIIEILMNFSLQNQSQKLSADYIDLLFHCAITMGRKDIAEMMLFQNIDFHKHLPGTDKTPLLTAIENGHEEIVKFLLDKCPDLNLAQVDNRRNFNTMLHIAAHKGYEGIVKILLQHKVNPLMRNANGQNCLHLAAKGGSPTIIKDLLESCSASSLFIPAEQRGYTPFDIAVENSQEEAVKFFLQKGFSADCMTKIGLLPIHIAASKGHNGIVFLLLQYGTFVDSLSRTSSIIILSYTPTINHPETYEIISSSPGKCKIKYEENLTALYIAANYGYEEVVKTLLDRRADPNICFKNFLTPLHAAAKGGHKEIVEMLIRKGAKVNLIKTDECISTPLLAAAEGGHEEVVELLLQFNADPKAQLSPLYEISKCIDYLFRPSFSDQPPFIQFNSSFGSFVDSCYVGYTALHFAVIREKERIIEMLLMCGADVNAETRNKKTPLYLAVKKQNLSIVKQLIKFGANLVSYCTKGLSPFFLAIKCSRVDILKTLLINGAPFEMETPDGLPVLHFAMDNKCDERMFQYLLRCGANVNVVDNNGLTILHWFFQEPCSLWEVPNLDNKLEADIEIFKVCVESCPDVNILTENNMHETALHMATKAGRASEVDILLDNNADVNKVDIIGKTPLFYALKKLLIILDELRIYEASLQNFAGFMSHNHRSINFRTLLRFQNHRRSRRRSSSRCNNRDALLCRSVACSITQVIARLEACNANIHPENLIHVNSPFVKPYYEICMKEIKKMKEIKIVNNTTYFHVFVANENEICYSTGNKTIAETLRGDIPKTLFPEYARFFKVHAENGLKRRVVMQKSLGALKQALNFELPIIVAYEILEYLKTDDMMNLCKACVPISCETIHFDKVCNIKL